MILTIIYIHHSLRLLKDTLIISHLGTENISAIKTWLVLPLAMIFMVAYIKISDYCKRMTLFYILIWFFIVFFVVFAFVLYPHSDILTIDTTRLKILQIPALKYIANMVSHWHYCVFFACSELFVTAILSISFWQLMNHITSIEESKRFYPLFGISSQIGLMLAGISSKVFSAASLNWQVTLQKTVISDAIAAVVLTICIAALSKNVGTDKINSIHNPKIIAKKEKITLSESLKYIFKSKSILLIAALLLCFNISLNLVEGVWKKSAELYFSGNANLIQNFISSVIIYISIATTLSALISLGILRYFKWRTAALIQPIITTVIGVIFFLLVQFKDSSAYIGIYPLSLSLIMYSGAAYYLFSRSMKNTLFDSTKEMAYIPLPDILQSKGKAAAETIGIRLGKGGSGLIQQILLMIFTSSTLIDLAPFFAIVFIALMATWIAAVFSLGRLMQKAKA